MVDYLSFKFDNDLCLHNNCDCKLTVQGHGELDGFKYTAKNKDKECQLAEIASRIVANYRLVAGRVLPIRSDETYHYLKTRISQDLNMKFIDPPIDIPKVPEPLVPEEPDVRIKDILKNIDRRRLPMIFKMKAKDICFDEIWYDTKVTVPSLVQEIMRRRSLYWMAYGSLQGRGHHVSAMNNLYPYKLADAIVGYNRHVHKTFDKAKPVLAYIPLAINYLYNAMGIYDFGKLESEINICDLKDMYLGSSSGIHSGPIHLTILPDGMPVKISNNGKKAECFESDVDKLIAFLSDDENFEVFFSVSPKNENFFDRLKMLDPEAYERWVNKVRLFVIPSSTFIIAEKLISKMRMLKERGLIMIGFKWIKVELIILLRC